MIDCCLHISINITLNFIWGTYICNIGWAIDAYIGGYYMPRPLTNLKTPATKLKTLIPLRMLKTPAVKFATRFPGTGRLALHWANNVVTITRQPPSWRKSCIVNWVNWSTGPKVMLNLPDSSVVVLATVKFRHRSSTAASAYVHNIC